MRARFTAECSLSTSEGKEPYARSRDGMIGWVEEIDHDHATDHPGHWYHVRFSDGKGGWAAAIELEPVSDGR